MRSTMPHDRETQRQSGNTMRTEASRRRCLAAAAVAALACASLPATGRAATGGTVPYPKSTATTSFNLDWNSLRRLAPGSDNWAATWASDGLIYTTWGDGGGFGNARQPGLRPPERRVGAHHQRDQPAGQRTQ